MIIITRGVHMRYGGPVVLLPLLLLPLPYAQPCLRACLHVQVYAAAVRKVEAWVAAQPQAFHDDVRRFAELQRRSLPASRYWHRRQYGLVHMDMCTDTCTAVCMCGHVCGHV